MTRIKTRTKLPSSPFFYCAATLSSIALVSALACGGASSNQTMSAAQAQAISQEFASAVDTALEASLATGANAHRVPANLSTNLATTFSHKLEDNISQAHLHPEDSSGCVTSDNGTSCNIPVSYTGSCPQGGTIGVTGDFDFTLDNSGDGSDSTTLTITPTGCAVSNLTIQGNPNVTFATQLSFQDDAPVYPITLTESGGITYGPNPSGMCTINATLTISSAQSCSISGTLCGQTLSGNCTQVAPPPDIAQR